MFGCNQLRCGRCGQSVQSAIDTVKHCRRYHCACQSRDEYSYLEIGADAGDVREFRTQWRCDGHPRLPLPTELDGIAVPAGGPPEAFDAIVHRALTSPPFLATGFRGTSFWVQRLFHLLVDRPEQAMVSQAVASELSSTDPKVVRAASDVFREVPWAPGAEQLAVVAERDRDRLRATPDPASQTGDSLHERLLEVLEPRLAMVHSGTSTDPFAIEVAQRALLAGEAGTGMIYVVADVDPIWLCDHAADIVRAKPDEIEYVLYALKDLPAQDRDRAVVALQALGKPADKAVRAWIKENPALAPAKSAPAQSAPAQSAPAQSAPAQSAPAQSAPAQSAPAQSAPAQSAPVKSTRAQSAPATSAATAPGGLAPHAIDGATLTEQTDFAALVREVLLDRGEIGMTNGEDRPQRRLERVLAQLAGSPYEERLSRGIAACLTAPEPEAQSQALIFFQNHPTAPGSERIIELVTTELARFRGIADPVHPGVDLAWQLLYALAIQVSRGDRRAAELARAAALRPGDAAPVVAQLVTAVPDWVLAHAEQIVRGTPSAGSTLLIQLQNSGRDLAQLAEQVARLSRGDTDFESDIADGIDDPALRQRILGAFRAAPTS
jgi:hypothetical protein